VLDFTLFDDGASIFVRMMALSSLLLLDASSVHPCSLPSVFCLVLLSLAGPAVVSALQMLMAIGRHASSGTWQEMLATYALSAELLSVWNVPASKTNKGGSDQDAAAMQSHLSNPNLEHESNQFSSEILQLPPSPWCHLPKWRWILGCSSCPDDDGQHRLLKELQPALGAGTPAQTPAAQNSMALSTSTSKIVKQPLCINEATTHLWT
jgi:hypothetical protein